MTEFTAEVRQEDPHVLAVSGELDIAAADTFLTQARAVLSSAEKTIELDFEGVTFIDSTGIGALVRLREEAREQGKEVTLTHVPRQVVRVLELTGLSAVFLDPSGG